MQEKRDYNHMYYFKYYTSTFPEFYHIYLIFSMAFVFYDFHMYSDVCCGSYKS